MATPTKEKMRVCILASHFPGPQPCGGIGTAVYWQARTFAEAGITPTVFYTGNMVVRNAKYWRNKYLTEDGIEFVDSADWAATHRPELFAKKNIPALNEAVRSGWFVEFLRDNYFPVVYLQDYPGDGLRVLQVKKAGLGFEKTKFITTSHGSLQWGLENFEGFIPGSDILVVQHMERQCVEMADYRLAPSAYMKEWVCERWGMPAKNITVLPNCFENGVKGPALQKYGPFDHLVYFGRFESRKGLELLTEALTNSPLLKEKIKKVTFLGENGQATGVSGLTWIENFADEGHPFEVEALDKLNTFEAWEWLRKQKNILAVAPSTADNLPCTVVELFLRRIPFVSTYTGGIPSIVGDNPEILAEATVEGLRTLLEDIVRKGKVTIRYNTGQQPQLVKKQTTDFYYKAVAAAKKGTLPMKRVSPGKKTDPMVSVIIPHFNTATDLRAALTSLKEQNCAFDYEVITVDDASPRVADAEGFAKLKQAYAKDKRYYFLQQKKSLGMGAACNVAAAKARGRYLIFFDASNEALPKTLASYCSALEYTGCDAMTCWGETQTQTTPANGKKVEFLYAPIGPAMEAGLSQNVFGDKSAIVRREVFKRMGGFSADTRFHRALTPGHAYWDFLAKLALSGAQVSVVPEVLYVRRNSNNEAQDAKKTGQAINYFRNRYAIMMRYCTPEGRNNVDWMRILGQFEGGGGSADVYHYFAHLPDEKLLQAIGRKRGTLYDSMVAQMRETVLPYLREWATTRPRIYIYGAGLHTRALLGVLPELAQYVVGFIDKGSDGKRFLRWPCIKPQHFEAQNCDVILYSSRENEKIMCENMRQHPVQHIMIYDKAPAPC